jgi:hypothetical protein
MYLSGESYSTNVDVSFPSVPIAIKFLLFCVFSVINGYMLGSIDVSETIIQFKQKHLSDQFNYEKLTLKFWTDQFIINNNNTIDE